MMGIEMVGYIAFGLMLVGSLIIKFAMFRD
jgi:hypothetical protein